MFLLYNHSTRITGRVLGDYLGIPHGDTPPREAREDHLVRWGSTSRIRYIPDNTINRRSAIRNASNKRSAFEILSEAGIRVPRFSDEPMPLSLRRTVKGFGGRGIDFIYNTADARLLPDPDEETFFVRYIPKSREFRVHTFGGRVIKTQEKILEGEVDDLVAWNGAYFRHIGYEAAPRAVTTLALAATAAIGLDFGAVDIIEGEDGNFYFLEINTAPGLTTRSSVEAYGDKLSQLLNLGDVPGIEATNLQEELAL